MVQHVQLTGQAMVLNPTRVFLQERPPLVPRGGISWGRASLGERLHRIPYETPAVGRSAHSLAHPPWAHGHGALPVDHAGYAIWTFDCADRRTACHRRDLEPAVGRPANGSTSGGAPSTANTAVGARGPAPTYRCARPRRCAPSASRPIAAGAGYLAGVLRCRPPPPRVAPSDPLLSTSSSPGGVGVLPLPPQPSTVLARGPYEGKASGR